MDHLDAPYDILLDVRPRDEYRHAAKPISIRRGENNNRCASNETLTSVAYLSIVAFQIEFVRDALLQFAESTLV